MSPRMNREKELKIKILIVDDDKVIADILFDLISDSQRSVDVCHDGLVAIECIQKCFYDLIIVDLVMPKVGGLDILKYVKKTSPDSLVIILTGYASLETAIEAIREGAYDYIRKPCKLEEIKISLDNAVDKIRLHRENRELLDKLQAAYRELLDLKNQDGEEESSAPDERSEDMRFFRTSPPNLHYLYSTHSSSTNCVDKLEALIGLRERGMITENEFSEFKKHLMKMIRLNG